MILYTDKTYCVVQHFPKRVLFINSRLENISASEILDDYMQKRGFKDKH